MNATEKLGIGRFETSEELARELEAKNKAEIAARVREISRNQASAQSIELRNRLREELNWQEHKEIREALAWTWVERVFDKDMTPEEKAIAEVWAVIPWAAWVTQKLWWIEKWWKSASDSFSTAWDLLKQWKFMAAIAVFFKWITWKFSLSEWNKKPGEENESQANWSENISEDLKNDYKYTAWISLIIKAESFTDFEKRTDPNFENINIDWNLHAIFLNKNFYEKKFSELDLNNLSKEKKNWIANKLWITEQNDESVYNALLLLKRREWFLDKILKDKQPNWRELTVKEVVINLHRYSSFFTWLNNVSIESLTTKWNDFIKLWEDENSSWPLNEMLDSQINDKNSPFYWIDKSYLLKIYSINWSHDFNKDSLLFWNKEKKYSDFIDKFKSFKENLPQLLKSWFFAGKNESKQEFNKFIDEKTQKLSPREIMEYFIITNWKIESEGLNDVQNTMIFTKVLFLLNEKPDLQWETYLFAIRQWLFENNINIPPAIKNSIWLMLRAMWEKVINSTWWMTQRLWWMLDWSEKAIAIWWSVLALAWLIYFIKVTAAWSWLLRWTAIWAWTMLVWQVYNYFESNKKSNPDYQSFKRDNNIKTQDDFVTALIK